MRLFAGEPEIVQAHFEREDEDVELVAVDPGGGHGTSGELLDTYRLELEAVSAAIAGGGQPEFAAADAVAQARAVAAIDQAAQTGAPVTLSSGGGSARTP
jgi:predicted dehydrogenase